MLPSQLLRKNGWTKGANARDVDGNKVDYNSELACCFCAFGAIKRCFIKYEDSEIFLDKCYDILGSPLPYLNDRVWENKEQVIEFFEKVEDALNLK